MRKETRYNKVVNFDEEYQEITVLGGIFEYIQEIEYATGVENTITMRGATGSKFEPISKERYNEVVQMDEDEIADYLIDAGFELPESCLRGGFLEWAEQFTDEDKLQLFFDLSYENMWDDIREELSLSEEEAKIFNCIGGGRCFDKDFQGNINPELSKIIRNAEAEIQ